MTNPNNTKNGAAASIPPNTEAEDLIKSNKSTMQQLMDANETIKNLKIELIDREAQLLAAQDLINQVLTAANNDSSTLFREINKSLVVLSDMVKSVMEPAMQQGLTQIRTQIPDFKKQQLSAQYRDAQGLPPLDIGNQGSQQG